MLTSILKGCNDVMRVLNTITGQFEEINPQWTRYAILSHTWTQDPKGEQTYQQLGKIQRRYAPSDDESSDEDHSSRPHSDARIHSPPTFSWKPTLRPIWEDSKLSPKIREACRVARENGYYYLWIDSCCIDKTSSSELSESINSMYQWYACAHVCFAFLPDVPAEEDHRKKESRFRGSRWFKRGWTLQELIAPLDVWFLSMEWTFIGSKDSLADLVVEITLISYNALLNIEPLDDFSVAQQFSWAAGRKTTRVEDRAYSLLGIFDINMPTLYGEGKRAFRRLQEEIMRRTLDQSLFAWAAYDFRPLDPLSRLYNPDSTTSDQKNGKDDIRLFPFPKNFAFLTKSPNDFQYCTDITTVSHAEVACQLHLRPDQLSATEYTFTPHGIRTQLPVISLSDFLPPEYTLTSLHTDFPASKWYLIILGCGHKKFPGCLLARVCHIGISGSGGIIESLQSGRLIESGGRFSDLLPVSPATIDHLCSSDRQVSVKTLYIPQPERDGMGNIARRGRRHETIKLVLLEKTCAALSAQEYTATLRIPDDDHPCTHSLTLSHDTHTIIIDYQHTLGEYGDDGQQLTIEAQVKMFKGPVPQDTSGNLEVPPEARDIAGLTVLCRNFMDRRIGWYGKLNLQKVELDIPGSSTTLTVRLGLTFARPDYYLLGIELEMIDPPSPLSGHDDVAQAGPLENLADIDVASPELTNGGHPPGSDADAGQLVGPVDMRDPEGQKEEAGRSWRRHARTL